MTDLVQKFSTPADQESIPGGEDFDAGITSLEQGNLDRARVFLGLAALKKHAGAIGKLVELFEQQNDPLAFTSPLDIIHDSGPSLLDMARDTEDPIPYLEHARLCPAGNVWDKMLSYSYAFYYASEDGLHPNAVLAATIDKEMRTYFLGRDLSPKAQQEEALSFCWAYTSFRRALEESNNELREKIKLPESDLAKARRSVPPSA